MGFPTGIIFQNLPVECIFWALALVCIPLLQIFIVRLPSEFDSAVKSRSTLNLNTFKKPLQQPQHLHLFGNTSQAAGTRGQKYFVTPRMMTPAPMRTVPTRVTRRLKNQSISTPFFIHSWEQTEFPTSQLQIWIPFIGSTMFLISSYFARFGGATFEVLFGLWFKESYNLDAEHLGIPLWIQGTAEIMAAVLMNFYFTSSPIGMCTVGAICAAGVLLIECVFLRDISIYTAFVIVGVFFFFNEITFLSSYSFANIIETRNSFAYIQMNLAARGFGMLSSQVLVGTLWGILTREELQLIAVCAFALCTTLVLIGSQMAIIKKNVNR